MNVLVTGGSGFIGTHLCRKLAAADHDVRVLDLKGPAHSVEGVDYRAGDVRRASDVRSALADVSAVYHLAADAGVELCENEPGSTYSTNLAGTVQILETISKESRQIRFIFSGSAVVYGAMGRENEPLEETAALPSPISFYGAQKLGAEQVIALFCRKRGIPSVCFRFFNVYGPGQDPKSPYSGVISIFADRLKSGEPLYLNDKGVQTRDFVSVHDVVEACAKALVLDRTSCDAQPINLGSGRATRISELARMITDLSGKREARFVDRPARAGDILHSRASIERARHLLGWQPRIALNKGLQEIL